MHTARCRSIDFRDRGFALLGIASDGGRFQIDYSVDKETLLEQTASFCQSNPYNLKLFVKLCLDDQNAIHAMTSPDARERNREMILARYRKPSMNKPRL
jgi:hypothetical protein